MAMLLRVLKAKNQSPVGALIGADLFCNTVSILLQSTTKAEQQSHPPPDERLAQLRQYFLDQFGSQVPDLYQPAAAVSGILTMLRGPVAENVQRRRENTRRELTILFATYRSHDGEMAAAEKQAAAKQVAHLLLKSPGATLQFLRDQVTATRGADEPDAGSPERLLAYNAVLHFQKPLRMAAGLKI
jgi:hypothetical protein